MARASAVLCTLLAASLWMGPALLRADTFDNDAAHHIYWLYQFEDAELFPNDLSVEYFSSPSVAPIGYTALYAGLAPFVDVLLASQFVAVVLLLLTALFAWLLGKAAVPQRPHLAGLLALAITMALLSHIDLLPSVGLQRTFATPFTFMCLWALVARRYAWVGVSWLLAALTYPVIVPVLGLSACLVFLADLVRHRRLPPWWAWNGALGVAAVAVVLLGSGTPEHVGPMVTYEQAMQMEEFGPDGRQRLFGTEWRGYWLNHHRTGLGVHIRVLLAAGIAVLALLVLRRVRSIPSAAVVMGLTGVALWAAARMTLFDLYLPNRHSRWTVTAAVVVVLAVAGVAVLARLMKRADAGHGRLAGLLPAAVAVCAPVAVAFSLYAPATEAWRRPVDHDLEGAYAFIAELPKDTLVAAHPDLADFVPVRSRRSVLASTEISIAFMLGYYARLVPRIEASLRAAYATDWHELDELLRPFGVDVVLTHPSVWEKDGYYAPFADLAAELTSRGKRPRFVLRHPPPERILFRSGDTYVVRVDGRREVAREQGVAR